MSMPPTAGERHALYVAVALSIGLHACALAAAAWLDLAQGAPGEIIRIAFLGGGGGGGGSGSGGAAAPETGPPAAPPRVEPAAPALNPPPPIEAHHSVSSMVVPSTPRPAGIDKPARTKKVLVATKPTHEPVAAANQAANPEPAAVDSAPAGNTAQLAA